MDQQLRLELSLLMACLRKQEAAVPTTLHQFVDYVQRRDLSGSGFVTSFKSDETLKMLPETVSGDLNTLHGRLNDQPEIVGFVVMFKNGRLSWIEGFSYLGDPWPKVDKFELFES